MALLVITDTWEIRLSVINWIRHWFHRLQRPEAGRVRPTTAQTSTYGDPILCGKQPYYEVTGASTFRHSFTPNMVLSVAYRWSGGYAGYLWGRASRSLHETDPDSIPGSRPLGQTLTATLCRRRFFCRIGVPFPNFTGTAQAVKPFPQYNGSNQA